MKGLTCALAALAMAIGTCVAAKSDYASAMHRDGPLIFGGRESGSNGTLPLALVPNAGHTGIASAVPSLSLLHASASAEDAGLIKDIFPGSGSSYMSINGAIPPQPPVEAGGALLFIADDGTSGRELWRTDGTAAGTYRVKDICPGPSGSSAFPPHLVNVGGIIFFKADDGTSGAELWRSDGTEAGTFRVKDIMPGASGSNPRELVKVGGRLFFSAQDANGVELWRSDGTESGTRLIRDIGVGFSSDPRQLTSVGGALCFFVAGDEHGRELWRSDGTGPGTFMVKDIFPFSSSSVVSPDSFIDVGGTLFFRGNDGNGYRLWRSDGTPPGTLKITSHVLPQGPDGLYTTMVASGGTLFFAADHAVDQRGLELWRSDGTEAGTFRVKDIRPGPDSSGPQDLFVFGGAVYFRATEGTLGQELWRSDGTEAGTYMVKDCSPGNASGQPDFFAEVGGTLFFTASDTFGTEVWQSDGTAAGTFRVSSIRPGGGAAPQSLAAFGRTLVFTANDGTHGREPWVLALSNLPPTAADDAAATDEDTAVTISVLANDADPDGDPVALSEAMPAARGSVVLNPDNTVTYTPAADFNGTDSFTYTAADAEGNRDTATVTVTVNPVNDPPAASDTSSTTDEDVPVQLNLAAMDVDSSDLTFAIVSGPANGTLGTVNGSGVIYTPNPNFSGSDSFTYQANDGMWESNVATVSIMVAPVNDAPDAVSDSASTNEDAPAVVSVLLNDTDVEGDALTVIAAADGGHGTVALNPDGTVTYTPAPNFFGGDSFTYTVSDGRGGAATATVSVTVSPVNDAPTALDGAAALDEDTQVEITLAATDIDSAAFSFALVSQPANGTLSAVAGDKVIYTPDPNFNGADAFTFVADDGAAGSNVTTVSITVAPVADPPVLATVGDRLIAEGALLSFVLSASDPDGEQLTFGATGLPDGATLDPATGAFSWTPTHEQAGVYTVTFSVTDLTNLSAFEIITITVSDVVTNLGPVCSTAYPSLGEIWPPDHRAQTISIFGVTDPDDDPLAIIVRRIVQDEPTNAEGDGSASIDGGGIGTSQPWVRAERASTKKAGGNGRVYEIFFDASDGRGNSCTGSVKVGVPHDQGRGPAVDDVRRYDSAVAGGPCLNCNP